MFCESMQSLQVIGPTPPALGSTDLATQNHRTGLGICETPLCAGVPKAMSPFSSLASTGCRMPLSRTQTPVLTFPSLPYQYLMLTAQNSSTHFFHSKKYGRYALDTVLRSCPQISFWTMLECLSIVSTVNY